MTGTMPRVTFRAAYEWEVAEGRPPSMESAMIGGVEVGRIQTVGKTGQYIFWLPTKGGLPLSLWRQAKTPAAAKNALLGEVRDWLRKAGLQQAEQEAEVGPE